MFSSSMLGVSATGGLVRSAPVEVTVEATSGASTTSIFTSSCNTSSIACRRRSSWPLARALLILFALSRPTASTPLTSDKGADTLKSTHATREYDLTASRTAGHIDLSSVSPTPLAAAAVTGAEATGSSTAGVSLTAGALPVDGATSDNLRGRDDGPGSPDCSAACAGDCTATSCWNSPVAIRRSS